MPHIRIEAKPVIGGTGHLYLVYVDDTGNEFVLRGGPEFDTGPVFGNITIQANIPLAGSGDSRPEEDRDSRGSVVLDLGGQDPAVVWAQMVNSANLIGSSQIDYDALFHNGIEGGANSNSVVAYVMSTVGLDVRDQLPNNPDGVNANQLTGAIGDGLYPGIEEQININNAIRASISNSLNQGEITFDEMLEAYRNIDDPAAQQLIMEGITGADGSCFGPDVCIDMWPLDPDLTLKSNGVYDQDEVRTQIWKKPINLVETGDIVVSFDPDGNLAPGPVIRTFQNDAKILLNFHGTSVTPGHVYYREDSEKPGKFETLIDVLREDGVIQRQDGTLIRAATNVQIGDPSDGYVKAVTGTLKTDGALEPKQWGRIRLGTRFLVGEGEERKAWAVADLIQAGGGVVGDDELIRVGDGEPMPFHWEFGDTLPNPEDFVLACSGTTLEEIYKAAEWESQGPRLPAPMVLDGGPVQPLTGEALSAMPRNEPLEVTHAPVAERSPQPTLNRKQRKAIEAEQRKVAKANKRIIGPAQ